ncbi:hypothetical protein LCGC14_1412380 [marine sediment metagenome]|uniref:Polynucleotide kinase n=1 Tax=marine sediment metagenome TaxID=412755 RepID=A0A0F9M989_9ZZZZ
MATLIFEKRDDVSKFWFDKSEASTIAIDFDGVIHAASMGFHDGTVYDKPKEGVKEALQDLSKKYSIVIFSTKARPDRPLIEGKTGIELIEEWLRHYDLDSYIQDVTCVKPRAVAYIDDKGFRFHSWKQVLSEMKECELL